MRKVCTSVLLAALLTFGLQSCYTGGKASNESEQITNLENLLTSLEGKIDDLNSRDTLAVDRGSTPGERFSPSIVNVQVKKKVFVSGKWRYLGDHSWFDPSRCAWRMLKMPNMETTSSDMSGDDLELQITTSAITDIGVHKAITYDLHLTSLRNEYLCRAYTYNVYKADDGTTYYIRNTSPDAIRIWAGRYRIDIQFNGNFYINHRY